MFVRLLLDAKRVGSVIGQRGRVITAIREHSEAKILIAVRFHFSVAFV